MWAIRLNANRRYSNKMQGGSLGDTENAGHECVQSIDVERVRLASRLPVESIQYSRTYRWCIECVSRAYSARTETPTRSRPVTRVYRLGYCKGCMIVGDQTKRQS